MHQLMLWDFRPDDGFLCDGCRNLVWHANGDGYCCCLAPGMGHINAKTRKPSGSECRFMEPRRSVDTF